jgi:flagellar assembly protein FliH
MAAASNSVLPAPYPFRAEIRQPEGQFLPLPGLTAPESHSGFHPRRPSALVAASAPAAAPPLPEPPPAPAIPGVEAGIEAAPSELAVMPRPSQPNAALAAEIHAAALAEGQALGRAEAEAALSAKHEALAVQARALAAALAQLASPPLAEVETLTRSLGLAVNRLASERAGLVIDSTPAPFAERIARLVERVAQGMRDVAVHLNPDDLAALRPLLEKACPPEFAALATARLVPDSALSRGDADLRAPGLRLADLIEGAAPGLPREGVA